MADIFITYSKADHALASKLSAFKAGPVGGTKASVLPISTEMRS
jgi:hypothetical protein